MASWTATDVGFARSRPLLVGLIAGLLLVLAASGARAEDTISLTPRPGVSESLQVSVVDGAPAALLLFPGNNGVVSGLRNNFLLRARGRFVAAGFTVGALDAPSDHYGMDSSYRSSAEHGQDIATAVSYLADKAHAPVWLVGTSNGTISAANGAVRLGPPRVAGVVLTSTVWSGGMSYVPIGEIAIPVLLIHNRDDGCPASPFLSAQPALDNLHKTPAKELVVVSSQQVRDKPCEGLSPHGYYGIEDQVVGAIATWIKAHPPGR